MGPQLLCKRKTCISALSPKDSNFSVLKHWKQTSEISSNFPHESKMKPRVASFLYRKSRIHCVSLAFSQPSPSALSAPYFPLFPPRFLDSVAGRENWLIKARGSLQPWGFVWVVLTRKGSSLSPSLQMALRFQCLPAMCSPHTALLPEAPPELWAVGSTSFCHCECSPSPALSGFNPSFAWLHTTPSLLREPEWQMAAWCLGRLHRWVHMPQSGKNPIGRSL